MSVEDKLPKEEFVVTHVQVLSFLQEANEANATAAINTTFFIFLFSFGFVWQ